MVRMQTTSTGWAKKSRDLLNIGYIEAKFFKGSECASEVHGASAPLKIRLLLFNCLNMDLAHDFGGYNVKHSKYLVMIKQLNLREKRTHAHYQKSIWRTGDTLNYGQKG